jgi:hypothetical protein
MGKTVWCQQCGGGGGDDKPPYIGICMVCGGSGELEQGEFEKIMGDFAIADALQANHEKAMEFQFQMETMKVVTRDQNDHRDCLREEVHYLLEVVEVWFKELIEDDPDKALAIAKNGIGLGESYICEHEPANSPGDF